MKLRDDEAWKIPQKVHQAYLASFSAIHVSSQSVK